MLDSAQVQAVQTIEGPILCVAGPGAGKTTVIVNHVHYMVQHGIDPSKILVLSFGNTDADNARRRYEQLDGAVEGPYFSTIHAFAYRVIRETVPISFHVLTDTDQSATVQSILKDMQQNLIENQKMSKREAARKLPDVKSAILDISRYKTSSSARRKNFKSCIGIPKETCLAIYEAYERLNEASDAIDFDDMLLLCRKLFKNKATLQKYRNQFPYIIIDEFQDTNDLQAALLYELAAPKNNIFACGDEDQSIYGFRNANPGIMLQFPKKFPEAKVIRLSNNYRSGNEIVQAASNLISHNKKRFDKDLKGQGSAGQVTVLLTPADKSQYKAVAEHIAASKLPGTTAMLCRTNQEVYSCAQALASMDIPFVTPGVIPRSPYDSLLCQVLMSYLRIAFGVYTTDDIRITANRPFRYISLQTLSSCDYSFTGLRRFAASGAPSGKRFAVMGYLKTVRKIQRAADENLPFAERAKNILSIAEVSRWITESCEDKFADPRDLRDTYLVFKQDMQDFDSFSAFSDYINAEKDAFLLKASQNEVRNDAVQVLTMHRSKGKEWDNVYVLSCNKGNMPYENRSGEELDEEEERRLAYVDVTRAKTKCYLVVSGDKAPSRFIRETGQAAERKTS